MKFTNSILQRAFYFIIVGKMADKRKIITEKKTVSEIDGADHRLKTKDHFNFHVDKRGVRSRYFAQIFAC